MTRDGGKPQPVEGARAVACLRAPEHMAVRLQDRVQAVAERLNLAIPAVRSVSARLPLSLNGAEHKAARADVAALLQKTSPDLTARIPTLVAERFAPLARPGEVDMLGTVIVPLVNDVLAGLSGTDYAAGPDSLISRLFSQSLGPARRRRLEAEMADLVGAVRRAHPEDPEDVIFARITLVVLGRDATIGTLSESLATALRPDSAGFARVPLATGVPYVDRIAPGAGPEDAPRILRCQLDTLTGEDDRTRLGFFGAGPHTCLGRPVTLALFDAISTWLSRADRQIDILAFERRRDDVFYVPSIFRVAVS